MKQTLWIIIHLLKLRFRKKMNMLIYFVLPVALFLVSFVFASTAENNIINIGIVNSDTTEISNDLIKSLAKIERFIIKSINQPDVRHLLSNGTIDFAISIPNEFGNKAIKGEYTEIEVISIKGKDTTAWVETYLNHYVMSLMDIGKISEGNIRKFQNMYENIKNPVISFNTEGLKDESAGKSISQQGIGFLIMFILMQTFSTASTILKEKEDRTYYRIYSTPTRSASYITANVLVNMLILTIQIVLVLFFASTIFRLSFYVAVWQIIIVLFCFGLSAVGIGFTVTMFSRSMKHSGNLSLMIILPTSMIGGCLWPLEVMPEKVTKIANLVPQKWALEAVGKLQMGASLRDISPHLFILLGFAIGSFIIAVHRMRFSAN